MSSEYFTEVCAYLRYEHRGPEMDNWRAGMVAATVANASGRYSRKMTPKDFFPPKAKKHRLSADQEKALKRLKQQDGRSKRRNSSG